MVTSTEIQELAAVANQIISVRECKPIIGIVQDVALGVYRFTKSVVRLNEKQMMNLLAVNIKGDCIVPKPLIHDKDIKKWNGRQVMSTIIPPNTNIKAPNKLYDDEKPDDSENFVVIENGVHKQGIMDKLIYQNRTRGLIHSIFNECNPDETRIFLDNTQKVICDWLVQAGFSVGVSDIIIDSATEGEIKKMVRDMKVDVYDKIKEIHTNQFKNTSISNNNEFFETEVNKILNQTSNKVGKIAKSKINDLQNRMINMVNSGSKGSIINVSQMMACLGQVNVDGKRIAYGFDDRTLPHYTKFDDGPESRGFIENSFIKGLTPQEFFFHAMGGREGLIDTAVKSVTGDTPIIIMEDGIPKYVKIGDWIDGHLAARTADVKHFEERQMELLDLDNDVYVPTMDEDGVVTWGQMTAVTRHDPGTELYEIKTLSGKSVIVTESKSLLTWDNELKKFKEVSTPEVKVGDMVPTTMALCDPPSVVTEVVVAETVFQLTRENGIQLGRFIASENKRNLTPEIQPFVEAYIGYGERDMPDVVFVAPKEFAKGLLIGVLTCTNTQFLDGAIQSKTTKRMAEAILMVCSRFGVYGSYTEKDSLLRISGYWKRKLFEEVWPAAAEIQARDNVPLFSDVPIHNDVILDKIVEINLVDVAKYPKVYDVTVPSTLNFGLANGLQVRDTSETGYIQRKLVKAMEDAKINYDYTVRNASGAIVQFLYGEDGMDAAKIESQPIIYIEKDFAKLKTEYLLSGSDDLKYYLSDETLKEFLGNKGWEQKMEEHFQQVLKDREYFITKMFDNKKETSILYPVSLLRLINNAKALFRDKGLSDLNPMVVLNTIEALGEELQVTKINKGNMVLKMLLRCYLSPKKVAMEYKFNKATFEYLVQQIKLRFYDAIAHPSEMVGVIAAQSIGEPCTQIECQSVRGGLKRVLPPSGC